MVEKEIISIIQKYLKRLGQSGIQARKAVVFGSFAGSKPVDEWSDIDVLIISPKFDAPFTRDDINILWRVASDLDSRIEPIAVGEVQWLDDRQNPIIESARRQGMAVTV